MTVHPDNATRMLVVYALQTMGAIVCGLLAYYADRSTRLGAGWIRTTLACLAVVMTLLVLASVG
jgi:hypothetical protein